MKKKDNSGYTYFKLSYTDVDCYYYFRDGLMRVGIKTNVPKGYYHSFLNDAGKEAEEHYNRTYSITQVNSLGEIVKA